MAHADRTRTDIARRTAEGNTTGEIARMLKRSIARDVYKALPTTVNRSPPWRSGHRRSRPESHRLRLCND